MKSKPIISSASFSFSIFKHTSLKSFLGLSLSVLFDGNLPEDVEKVAEHNCDSHKVHDEHVDEEHFLLHWSRNPAGDVIILNNLLFYPLRFTLYEKVTNMWSTFNPLFMAKRCEAKSAKRSFASKIF